MLWYNETTLRRKIINKNIRVYKEKQKQKKNIHTEMDGCNQFPRWQNLYPEHYNIDVCHNIQIKFNKINEWWLISKWRNEITCVSYEQNI